MAWFIRTILANRSLAAALLLISIALAIYSSRTIRFRFQFRDFYDYPESRQLPLFKQDNEEFGDPAGFVVAMVKAEDVFVPQVLDYVRALTQTLEQERVFSRVRSLTNVHVIRGDDNDLQGGPLLPNKVDAPTVSRIRTFAMQSSLLRRSLISEDGRVTGVLAEMRIPSAFASVTEQREALDTVKKAVLRSTTPPQGVSVTITGSPAVEVGVTDALIEDQILLVPAVILVLAAVLFITFQSLHGVLLCMSAVGVATIWTAGLFALLHRPVDIIGSIIPIAILVYGVVDPIFVLTRVLQKLDAKRSKEDAIVEAFSELTLPCILTSLTTAFGFAVFLGARAPSIRYFGFTVALGVLLGWVTTVTVLPLLLAITPVPRRRRGRRSLAELLQRAFGSFWTVLRRHRRAVLISIGVFLVAGGCLVRKQSIDNVYVDALPRGQTLTDARSLERTLSGVLRVIVHLEGPRDVMRQPRVLKAIEQVGAAIRREQLVTHSSSLADLVGEANQAFQGGDPSAHHVPQSISLTAQYLAMLDPIDRADFVTDDYSKAHIDILLKDTGSQATRAFVSRLRGIIKNCDFEELGVDARLTGNGVVGYDELDSVVREIVYGFVMAFAAIILMEWVAFRSLRIALISMLPNLVPVVVCFLALKILGMRLRIESALVLCVAIGGLFNTTIHFAARARQRAREVRESVDESILYAMRVVGPAALFTAVSLSAGFAVLIISPFPALRTLGLFSMLTLLTGFVSDMVFTSALMSVGLDRNSILGYPEHDPQAASPQQGKEKPWLRN